MRHRLILYLRLSFAVLAACVLLGPWETLAYSFVLAPFAACLGFWPGSCFCVECTIFSDGFSADNIATNYDERSGNWTVSGGAVSTTDASALLVTNATTDVAATGAHATVTMTMASTSDKGRLILGYVDDDNYWYVEVQPGTTDGSLKLFERSGGTDTQRGSTATIGGFTPDGIPFVCLSIGGGVVKARVNNTVLSYSASPSIANTKCALGSGGGSSSVSVDDLQFRRHHADNSNCAECSAVAFDECCSPPDTLYGTVEWIDTGCPDFPVTLTRYIHPGFCESAYVFTVDDTCSGLNLQSGSILCGCPSGVGPNCSPHSLPFYILNTSDPPVPGECTSILMYIASCEPFYAILVDKINPARWRMVITE